MLYTPFIHVFRGRLQCLHVLGPFSLFTCRRALLDRYSQCPTNCNLHSAGGISAEVEAELQFVPLCVVMYALAFVCMVFSMHLPSLG